ncbi:MAG: hypothetical protein ACKO8Z_10550 [Prosthecobacter sp.]
MFVITLASAMTSVEAQVVPGCLLLASGEGISVFDRDVAMKFGRFFVPVVNGKGEATPWSDIAYDGCRLPSGHYLCSSHEWLREISPDGKIVWEYRVQKPVELKTCVPLPNGDVMTTDASTQELVRLTNGQVVKRVPIPSAMKASPHNRYNLLRRTPAGTFLLAMRAEKAFIELDESGKELWRHPVPDLPVVAERLANGNTLMSWRGGLLEVNAKHEVVWELKAADIKDFTLLIFGGFHRFENGNTLIANSDWHYHDAKESAVQLFEVTRDKKVVWKLGVEAFAGRKPGSLEPKTGNIEHRIIGIQWLGTQPIPKP